MEQARAKISKMRAKKMPSHFSAIYRQIQEVTPKSEGKNAKCTLWLYIVV